MARRIGLVALVTAALVLSLSDAAAAQEGTPVEVGDLFKWATEPPVDWVEGLLFAGIGLAGALVILFTLVGGAVPGTAGQAQIDADYAVLQRLTKRLEDLINAEPPNSAVVTAVAGMVNEYRDDLSKERWRQFAIAGILYAVMGAFFASALAKDILQAFVLGATWTGLIGSLGLKRDYQVRKEIKDEAIKRLETKVKDVVKQAAVESPDTNWEAIAGTSDWGVATPEVARYL
jgi:hypothetical protein